MRLFALLCTLPTDSVFSCRFQNFTVVFYPRASFFSRVCSQQQWLFMLVLQVGRSSTQMILYSAVPWGRSVLYYCLNGPPPRCFQGRRTAAGGRFLPLPTDRPSSCLFPLPPSNTSSLVWRMFRCPLTPLCADKISQTCKLAGRLA